MESRKPYIPEWKKYLDSVEAAIMMANTLQWKGRDIDDSATERAMGWNLDYAAFLSMYLSVHLSIQSLHSAMTQATVSWLALSKACGQSPSSISEPPGSLLSFSNTPQAPNSREGIDEICYKKDLG